MSAAGSNINAATSRHCVRFSCLWPQSIEISSLSALERELITYIPLCYNKNVKLIRAESHMGSGLVLSGICLILFAICQAQQQFYFPYFQAQVTFTWSWWWKYLSLLMNAYLPRDVTFMLSLNIHYLLGKSKVFTIDLS